MSDEVAQNFHDLLWSLMGLALCLEALAIIVVGVILSLRHGSFLPICIALVAAEIVLIFIREVQHEVSG